METERINVLIVDDEHFVREGLRHILDWEAMGFCICDEAGNGEDALRKIRMYQPDLVLLDIRMPRVYGTDLMQTVRAEGFAGEFIILSGYSDFKYAQAALHSGASYYLTKPIVEAELKNAVLDIRDKIQQKRRRSISMDQYRTKARLTVLHDLLTQEEFNASINYEELGISASIYQVVIYEGFTPYFRSYDFGELLRVTNQKKHSFEDFRIDNRNIIILKGTFALERFQSCLNHYRQGTEKGSPLDTIFLAYSPPVPNLSQIHLAYETCCRLMERRFFCGENQHVLSYEMLPQSEESAFSINEEVSKAYGQRLTDYIKSGNQHRIQQTLTELETALYGCSEDAATIKYFLAGIFLQVKQEIAHSYPAVTLPLPYNAAILKLIEGKYYLYEILDYIREQSTILIRTLGTDTGESVFDSILDYIGHNYGTPLKLEGIAKLFGYNSSYLGKLFSQKMGMNFNAYLDQIRIREAVRLLSSTDLKVYEVATRVGFKDVDYFYRKFRRIMNQSPAEYRNRE